MARPERNEVDYFPFYCKEGKVMFILEQKYGNDGYATWIKILRSLAVTNYHYIDLSKEIDVYYLATKCRVSNEILLEIIDLLALSGEIDSQIWQEKKVIWNQKFIDSINDAYSRRNNKPIDRESLIVIIGGLCTTLTPETIEKTYNNTQSKVKETILKESKEEKLLSRKKLFASTLEPFVSIYGKDLVNEFYKYWTEPNKTGTKFRQELEKTWSLDRRLETWVKNDKTFKPTANGTTAKQPIDWEQKDRDFVNRVMGTGQSDTGSEGSNNESFTSYQDVD